MRHSGIIENNWTPFEPGQQKDKLSFKAKIPKFDNEGSRSPVWQTNKYYIERNQDHYQKFYNKIFGDI